MVCPSCGASGTADTIHAGKQIRCKHCQYRFAIPDPDKPEVEGYSLEDPDPVAVPIESLSRSEAPVFVASRGDEPYTPNSDRKQKKSRGAKSLPRSARAVRPDFPWKRWLARGGIAAVIVLTAITLFVPNGPLIAASILLLVGMVMVLAGYAAGAYGAFCEDFLYGFLYMTIPLYAAYYLVSRWDDLWVWFLCSTAGVVLILLGTEMLRWAGVNA